MYIDQSKCIRCQRCVPYCPCSAISLKEDGMVIDLDVCVECGVCEKNAKCPVNAIYNVHLEAPRAYRKAFSDPFGKHKNTALQHMGRGTEEVKTNDVTGILRDLDHVTFAVELGRPSVSASFADLEKVSTAVAPYAVSFEPNNPVTSLMVDTKTGKIDPSVLGERIMSAIVEFSCKLEDVEAVLEALKLASKQIDSVFSVSLISRVDEATDEVPARKVIDTMDINVDKTSAKTNLGLGRPRYEDRMKEAQS